MKESFARLFQSPHLGVVISTPERILDANDAYLRMIGHTREELLEGAIDWRKLTPPEFHRADHNAIEQLKEFGAAVPYEKAFVLRDGTRVDVVTGSVRLSEDPVTWACFAVDLSETKRLREAEEELLTRHKVINELAHELNNPMAALIFLLHLARSMDGLPPQHADILERAMIQLGRVTDVVNQVMAESRPAAREKDEDVAAA